MSAKEIAAILIVIVLICIPFFMLAGCSSTGERWTGYIYLEPGKAPIPLSAKKSLLDCQEAGEELADGKPAKLLCKLNCKLISEQLPYCETVKEYLLIGLEQNK